MAPLLFPWAPLGDALRRFGAGIADRHTRMANYKEPAVMPMRCAAVSLFFAFSSLLSPPGSMSTA